MKKHTRTLNNFDLIPSTFVPREEPATRAEWKHFQKSEPEPRSGMRSPFDPDRLCNPIPGGNKAPSEMRATAYFSKDDNFARIVNDKEKIHKGRRLMQKRAANLINKARVNKNMFPKKRERKPVAMPSMDFDFSGAGVEFVV